MEDKVPEFVHDLDSLFVEDSAVRVLSIESRILGLGF